ncbi:MAG: hypothetical protein GY799_00840, partial [Desulfobulbaceae bacterium]|nr:hypothetical protein [Desulfobulbaceae bacterium]
DLIVIRAIDEEFAGRLIEEAKVIPFVANEDPQEDVAEVASEDPQEDIAEATEPGNELLPDADASEEVDVPIEENASEGEGVKETGNVEKSDE